MKQRKYYAFLAASLILFTLLMLTTLRAYGTANIWTDKPDYSPGDTPVISGSGFLPNVQVTISITRPDSTVNTIYATTDGSGAFTCNYQLDGITGTYTVTATDGTNPATTTFTDTQKYFTSTISPTTASPGQTQTYTVTITDLASNPPGNKLGSATVSIPSGFTSISSLSVTAPSGKSWTVTLVSGEIEATAVHSSDCIDPGYSISVSFSATAPTTTGSYEWTTDAWTNPSWSGDHFNLSGSQPTVTVSATYKLTMATNFGTTSPSVGDHWYTAGSKVTISATAPAAGPGEQYVWNGWTGSGSGSYTGMDNSHQITIDNAAITETASWTHQYYLTMSTNFGTVSPVSGWHNAGSKVTIQATPPSAGSGEQYVWNGWTGSGSGSYSGSANPANNAVTMNGPVTETASWTHQYYLTVQTSPLGVNSPTGQGWYDAGSSAPISTPQDVDIVSGSSRYDFRGWQTGDMTEIADSSATTTTVRMDNAKTVTADYVTQYYLTVQTSPLGVNSPTGQGWYDAGSSAPISTPQDVDIVSGSSRYDFRGWQTGDMTEIADSSATTTTVRMDNAKTVTADYVTQYYITFAQTGVGSDFTGYVMNVDGTDYDRSGYSNWYDDGAIVTFSFHSPLSPSGGKRYVWTSTSGLSTLQSGTLTVTGSGSVTGNYKTQYLVSFTQTGSAVPPTVDYTANTDPTGTVPFSVWVKAGSAITYTYQAIVSDGPGVQFVLTGVTPASPQTVNGPLTIVGYYKTQYYLTVTTYADGRLGVLTPPPTPPSGWYDAGAQVTLTAPPTAHDPSGTLYTFYGDWSVNGKLVIGNPIKITMNQPTTAIAWYCDPPLFADINRDGKVDLTDLVRVARHFGAIAGSANYDFWCDLNEDGRINLLDLAAAARQVTA